MYVSHETRFIHGRKLIITFRITDREMADVRVMSYYNVVVSSVTQGSAEDSRSVGAVSFSGSSPDYLSRTLLGWTGCLCLDSGTNPSWLVFSQSRRRLDFVRGSKIFGGGPVNIRD